MVVGRRDAFSALQCNLDKVGHTGRVICHENDWLLSDRSVLVGHQNGVATLDLLDRSGFAYRAFAFYYIHKCASHEAGFTLPWFIMLWPMVSSILKVLLVWVAVLLFLTIMTNAFLILTRRLHSSVAGTVSVGHACINWIYLKI